MPSLPPPMWAELYYSGAWNSITGDLLQRTPVTVTRGLSSESSSTAEPTACSCDLESRDNRYAPRNPASPLYGLIGRNTPFRWGYTVGSPWAELPGGLTYSSLFVNDAPALDVTGDFDLRLDVALEDWSESQMLALRYQSTGDQRSWALEILNGTLTFMWSPTGLLAGRIDRAATEPVRGYNGQRMALRVTLDINNGSGGYELRFWTGRTVDDEEWHLLGDPIVGTGTTSVFAGSAYMELGAGFNFNQTPGGGSLNRMRGKAYALQLRDSGTVKVDMSTTSATPGGTTFVDATGLTWSRGGTSVLTNRHIRMAGEVPAWPPTRDLSGNDNYVSINPSGLTRRMDAGNRPQDSALLRYIKAEGPIECWPLTDGPRTTAAKSLVGGQDMQQEILIGEDTAADWQKGSLADWIEPVLAVKAETTGHLRGGLPNAPSAAGGWSVDLFLSGGGIPSSGQWTTSDFGAGTDGDEQNSVQIIFTGSLDRLTVVRQSYGDSTSSSGLLANIDAVGIYDEEPHHLRLTIDPSGGLTEWLIYVDGQPAGSGTIAGITFKAAREILFGWGFASIEGTTMSDRSVGYITYWDANGPSAAQMYDAYMGFQGELAGERIERLATEAGYTASVAGESEYQQPLGIQGQKKLLELLNEASATNFGYLLDRRDAVEVVHRGGSTLWNQSPALTLDYSAGLISPPFRPVDDDKLTENDVSVSREFGSVPARQVLEEGELSVLAPEDGGVGRYDTSYTYSLATDAQAAQVAGMRLHLGTYNGVRYTRLTLNLANERVYQHIDDILRIDVGDTIRLTNLPPDHGPDDVDVLVAGYSEEAGPDGWLITFNCVPGEPWTAGIVGSDTHGRADTGGSTLAVAVAVDADDTTLSVTSTGVRWVTGSAPTISDAFQRTVAGGWGTTDAGQAWTTDGGSSGDYSVSPGAGAVAVGTLNVSRYCLLPAPGANWDQAVSLATSAVASGGSMFPALAARYQDASNTYLARVQFAPGGTITLSLRKRVAGTETQLASYTSTLTHQAGVPVRVRWQGTGSTLRARIWADGRTEPDAWHVTATDTSLAAAGQIGMRTILSSDNTNTLPVTVRWSGLEVSASPGEYPQDLPFDVRTGGEVMRVTRITGTTSPQTFTVTRSINGVVKSHAPGQDIRLASPVYVAM
ncbi:hypothetical protein GCM10010294_67610 [Streptomyces griseoloalbus]|uniref:hypothetical protein n=1 Tax=Streptomyces griseoloalbus TaxID=67303 RepID=UPI0018740FA5|nr:hypothetical protein GCM10010294_67610 [Streptomyces griseoloalbus]